MKNQAMEDEQGRELIKQKEKAENQGERAQLGHD